MKTVNQYAEQAILDEIKKIKAEIAKDFNKWKNAVDGLAKAKDPLVFIQPGADRYKKEENQIQEFETLLKKVRAGQC